MDIIIETDPALRALKKFLVRIRTNIDDLSLPDPERTTPISERLSHLSEENKYGLIKENQLKALLEAHKKQPNMPLRCNRLEAGNLARLLFSKASFHNSTSTDYLIEDLKINDANRSSFLGGHSTYAIPTQNKLIHLRENQRRMYLIDRVKQISTEMDDTLKTQTILTSAIEKDIEDLIRVGGDNGDVLIVVGKRSIVQRKYDKAIDEFKTALKRNCTHTELAKQNLSDALYHKGYTLFQRNEFERASNCFSESIQHNPDNRGSKLHLEMVQKKLMERAPRRFGTIDTRSAEQRRR